MKSKKLLVACEESQRVCISFRNKGWEAYSCDIVDPSGGYPEWHIKQDVLPLLDGNCSFTTMDGVEHTIEGKWDMIIAFPPCTYLCVTGNRWFNVEKYGEKALKRIQDREEAADFFMRFVDADCEKIAIENLVGVMNTRYRKPNQIIQPYWFGERESKKTCLWLKGLPQLEPTNMVEPVIVELKQGKTMSKFYYEAWSLEPKERAKVRSTTFWGVAEAMAEQWG